MIAPLNEYCISSIICNCIFFAVIHSSDEEPPPTKRRKEKEEAVQIGKILTTFWGFSLSID